MNIAELISIENEDRLPRLNKTISYCKEYHYVYYCGEKVVEITKGKG